MLDVTDKRDSQHKFGAVLWSAVGIYLAGLAYLFVTEDWRSLAISNLAVGVLLCTDYFIRRGTMPRQLPSFTAPPEKPKRNLKYTWLMGGGFALMAVSIGFLGHPRIFSLIAACSLCILLFDRFKQERSSA